MTQQSPTSTSSSSSIISGSVEEGLGQVPRSTDSSLILEDEDLFDSDPSSPRTGATPKKAGRRKIKIEFIDDKSRRHITFSKRKAGIMKKAFELSTLTGTQVLLLVASETGHVYTFATSKLQPLISRPEGKNMIQQCLNATADIPKSPPSSASTTPTVPTSLSSSASVVNSPPRNSQSLATNPLSVSSLNIHHQQAHHQHLQLQHHHHHHHQQVPNQSLQNGHPQQYISHHAHQQYATDPALLSQYAAAAAAAAASAESMYNDYEKEQIEHIPPRRAGIQSTKESKAMEVRNYYNSPNHHHQQQLEHPASMGYGYSNQLMQQQQQQQFCQPTGHQSSASATPNRGYTPGGGSATSSPPSTSQFAYPPPHSMIGQYQ